MTKEPNPVAGREKSKQRPGTLEVEAAGDHAQRPGGRLRVAMIVGDNETRHCGVKDGAYQLADALRPLGVEVHVLAPESWSLRSVNKFVKLLKCGDFDVVHLEYPSVGYRGSLVPHLLGRLGVARASVVTLHEFTSFSRPQQLSTQLFRATADALLFVSDYERSHFNRRLGPLGPKQYLFPVVSQVPYVPSADLRDLTVIYFGQIRPNKGIEAFVELARGSEAQGKPYQFRVLGSTSEAHKSYARKMQATSPSSVEWTFDLSFKEVGAILGRSFAAYLPFPDGASERRGSLAAALFNGLPSLTRVGPATTKSIEDVLIVVDRPDQALAALDDLFDHPEAWERMSRISRAFAENRTWENVAAQHASIYSAVLAR